MDRTPGLSQHLCQCCFVCVQKQHLALASVKATTTTFFCQQSSRIGMRLTASMNGIYSSAADDPAVEKGFQIAPVGTWHFQKFQGPSPWIAGTKPAEGVRRKDDFYSTFNFSLRHAAGHNAEHMKIWLKQRRHRHWTLSSLSVFVDSAVPMPPDGIFFLNFRAHCATNRRHYGATIRLIASASSVIPLAASARRLFPLSPVGLLCTNPL